MLVAVGLCLVLAGAAGAWFSWNAREPLEGVNKDKRNWWALATFACLLLFVAGIIVTLVGII